MKRMIFCFFLLAAAVASGWPYSGLKDKCLDWPGWIDGNLIAKTDEPGESDLPMGQQLAIALLGGAECAAATQYAQHGKRPSSGWRLSDSEKDFSTMPRALDAQEGARTKRLIDIAYSVATNGANVTRGGAVYSPLFTSQTGNVRISGDTWRIDEGKQFAASKFAVGPGCGNILSDSVSHDWSNRFSAMISAAGGSPDDSGIAAELESRRDAFRDSMRENTVYPFATFKSESSVAVGHGRLPSARDVRWSNWLALQFNTMFVDIPESAITFDVEEKTATNSISIAGSEIKSHIISLIHSGPGDHWTEIVGGEINIGDAAYRDTNEDSPVPVSEWTAYFIGGDTVASGEAIYHIDSRSKNNDTGWVFWFSREEADGGRYDYYRRSWKTHIESHLQSATANANTYTAKRLNHWRRAVSWNFANTFPNWYDDADSRFLSAVDYLTVWAGYRLKRERTDRNGNDYEEDHGNIVYSDGTDPDMKNAVGDALFQVAYDSYMGDHENEADFDDFKLYIHTYFAEPQNDWEEGRVKVVYTPPPDDPMGQPKTSYYDDDHHGDPDPPRPENTDEDGVPAGHPTTGDPDDPSGGGSGPGDSDSIRVPVRVDVNSGGMEYTRRDIRTWSGFNLLGRYKFNFVQ